jgi:hypothetical protein
MKKMLAVLTVVLTLFCSTFFSDAAADPNVILVNPAPPISTVYSSNLLISVKLSAPKTIRVSVFEEKQIVNGTLSAVNVNTLVTANGMVNISNLTPVPKTIPSKFTSSNNLSFYTQQVNDLKPGLYLIRVQTLNSSDKEIYTNESYVVVKEKVTDSEGKIFESPQTGTMQFLQNLLKTIFGN